MKLPFKVRAREKRFLIVGGLAILAVIIFQAYTWYIELEKRADDFTEAKQFVLEKQLNRISGRNEVEKKVNTVKQELENQEKALLQGEKPPVAAAELQRVLKETAASLSIVISSERTLNPVDDGVYLGVPVEVGFAASTEKLRDYLHRLRNTPFLIKVSEVKVRVTNISNPTDVYTTLIVTGFIRKSEEAGTGAKEKDKDKDKDKGPGKEAKNAA